MNPRSVRLTLAAALLAWSGSTLAVSLNQRQHILVVGSSTAYPIIAAAAEYIGRHSDLVTPIIESTGTGGGIKLFCNGVDLSTPDIVMASRRMKDSEHDTCVKNKVNDVREIKIGYDGIVIANTKQGPHFDLTKHDLYLALANQVPSHQDPSTLIANPYTSWRQVNPALPDVPIRVLGPPPTSGTRDILVERLLHDACLRVPALARLHDTDADAFTHTCYRLREDGALVNAGENDARLVRKLLDDRQALGIFGYNFLDRNRDRLQASSIDGVEPEFELIESGTYPLSRPLYLYVKPQHQRIVAGLNQFIDDLLAPAISGRDGILIDQGLIPLTAADRAATQR